jgi:tetratricopeptide (TPR) repeat protein
MTTLFTFAAIGFLIDRYGSRPTAAANTQYEVQVESSFDERMYNMLASGAADSEPEAQTYDASAGDLQASFQYAVALLNARHYEQAVDAFHKVLMLQSEMPEANVNMGFSLLGLQRYELARQYFQNTIDLRPEQRNAYYGLAVAHEGLAGLNEAIRAMRIYVHLGQENDPYRRKAESALWEWEAELAESEL